MRTFAAIAAVLAFAAVAVPAGAPVQAQTLSAAETRDVAGTRWSGPAVWQSGEGKTWTLYFRPDGVLIYGYEGRTFDNGRWVQNERLVTFHTNTYYAQYSGTLNASGDDLSGAMFNRNGDQGQFRFERIGR